MNEHESLESDDPLGRRLRAEALGARPAFSAGLHARVMSAVRAAPLPESTAPKPANRARKSQAARARSLSWAMVTAGSIAVAVAIALTLGVLLRDRGPAREAVVKDVPDATGSPGHSDIAISPNPAPIAQSKVATTASSGDFDSAAEDVASTASGISDWVRATAGDNRWAGLDRDAKAALATVAAPLPFDFTFSVATSEPSEP